jgi:hypothetical protein
VPHLKELIAKHADAGFVVLGVHTASSGDQMPAFVGEQKITWPVAVDEDGATVRAFAVDSFPDYYLVDRAGKLRVADLANAAIDDAVAKLLAEPAPAADQGAPPAGGKGAANAANDAKHLFAAALADAKQTGRKVLVHVHGPG